MVSSDKHRIRSFADGCRIMVAASAVAFLMILLPLQLHAQTFSVVHSFTGGADGRIPAAGLTMDRAGNLYGTASAGGTQYCSGNGCGVVFKLSSIGGNWIFTTLYNFQQGSDGANPTARVIFGPNGNLYGTTSQGGGVGDACNALLGGCGTVFKLSPPASACKSALCPWRETVLYRFNGDDGASPGGEVVFDQSGNLYGTTAFGGTSGACNPYGTFGCGNVFELMPAQGLWTESVLYNFLADGNDGTEPFANVIFDAAGNLYGTTYAGGVYGGGAVFQLTASSTGWTENILYNQFNFPGGIRPWSGLAFDAAGNLFGTTSRGQPDQTGGTAFKLAPAGDGSWTFSTLYTFLTDDFAGRGPAAGLVMDSAGNFYGTSYTGGAYGDGFVYKMTPQGVVTSLHDFCAGGYPCTDGCAPESTVVLDASGNLYGTASVCGSHGEGVVWKIAP